ncbi:hypothetical protein BS623_23085 [Vibrio parahaemolyticus]|nr:hypothetical protein BS623_23085 [Vibrio parahaemolyticus]
MALKSHFGFISEGSHRLSWKLNGSLQSVQLEDKVTCTAYSETHDLVLVLTSSDGSSVGDKLIGIEGTVSCYSKLMSHSIIHFIIYRLIYIMKQQ